MQPNMGKPNGNMAGSCQGGIFVPVQSDSDTFPIAEAFVKGTAFPCLYDPYVKGESEMWMPIEKMPNAKMPENPNARSPASKEPNAALPIGKEPGAALPIGKEPNARSPMEEGPGKKGASYYG